MTTSNSAVFDAFAEHVSSGKVRHWRAYGFEFPYGRRDGPFVWDVEERHRLINCHVNGGCYNLGHRNPELIKALVDATGSLDAGNHHLPSMARAKLARRLADTSPQGGMSRVVFGSSGGEAIDVALKAARRFTGRRKIVSIELAYHGHTGLALGCGADSYIDYFNSSAEDNIRVPFNDLPALKAALDSTVAAVIVETVPATLGMPIPAPRYLAGIKAACERNGSLYIADEVQTGLGRTGRFWGVDHFGFVPDLLVTAKGLGGGLYPITATLMTEDVFANFDENPFAHVSTMGGAEIGCPVAERVIEISSDPAFLGHVTQLAHRFAEGFEELRARHPDRLVEVRQLGLFMGLKFNHPQGGYIAMKSAVREGVLGWRAGNDLSVMQFLPPLIIDLDLADEILERLDRACAGFARAAEELGVTL